MSNYSTTDMTAVDQLLVTITANMVRVRVGICYIPIPIDEPLAYTIYVPERFALLSKPPDELI